MINKGTIDDGFVCFPLKQSVQHWPKCFVTLANVLTGMERRMFSIHRAGFRNASKKIYAAEKEGKNPSVKSVAGQLQKSVVWVAGGPLPLGTRRQGRQIAPTPPTCQLQPEVGRWVLLYIPPPYCRF